MEQPDRQQAGEDHQHQPGVQPPEADPHQPLIERDVGPDIVQHQQREAEREKARSEEHTSELQSLMRISYAVFCLKKKPLNIITHIFIFYYIYFFIHYLYFFLFYHLFTSSSFSI